MDDPRDDTSPGVAPAPAPTPEAAAKARSVRGFDTSSRRWGLEFVVVASVVVGLGIGAARVAGVLAAWLTPLLPLSVDRNLGSVAARIRLGECNDPEAQRYVERLAEPLLEAAAPQPFRFEFRVADDGAVNAYALPGGFVTVNRGLLEKAESGGEVAGVLGHEIQHALLRHGTRRALRQMGAGLLLSLWTGGGELERFSGVFSDVSSVSYDRAQELEADRKGVALLVKAGIDPRGLAAFFARLREASGPAPPELLSTHPEPEYRASLVRKAARGRSFRTLPEPPEVDCSAAE